MSEIHGYRVGAEGQLWQWDTVRGQQLACCSIDVHRLLANFPIESNADYWLRVKSEIKAKQFAKRQVIAPLSWKKTKS